MAGRFRLFVIGAFVLAAISLDRFAVAVELVRDGAAVASIVVPDNPSSVESYAAKELQYHLERSTGAHLQIITESATSTAEQHIYLGRCEATKTAKLGLANLPANSYLIQVTDSNLFITGNDSYSDPLDVDTHEGTLFGVYELLENNLGVRWLWPGKLGEVIPSRRDVSLPPRDAIVKPLLWFKVWREPATIGEKIWLKRQRFGRSVQPQYGHSFGEYWTRFGQSHPEYFAMLPDGTRRLDPGSDSDPHYAHMCVSEPGLTTQIIADWQAKNAHEFLNVCENDGWAGCACPRCLAWDQPDPDSPVPFDQRLDAARKAFAGQQGRKDEWMLTLGSLSDRYAHFWKNISEQAARIRPDVKVVSYIYDNYRKPPIKATLNQNVLCGLVPQESIFGYSKRDSEIFRHDWSGWEKTGCQLFLRPNYTLQAPNFPAFYAHTLGEDLKFAMAHGLRGTDFDSLTGKYSVQGPSFYMLATILNHPEASPDTVLNEFYDAFGPAKESIQQYFALWESIYPNYSSAEQAQRINAKRKYHAGLYGPYYLLANEVYTPELMSQARSILAHAHDQAASQTLTIARIEWLEKGLRQADLLLATAGAFEHGIDTGDKTEFHAARQALTAFRNDNAEYDRENYAGLSGNESKWDGNKH